MWVGVQYLTFEILLHAKSEQKVIGNQFCTPILIKASFGLRNMLLTICIGCVWIVIYFLFEKQAFYGLLKVIGI